MSDANGLHRSSLSNDPIIREVLPAFIQRLRGHVQRLRELQAAGDAEGLRLTVHQLRGAAKSFGFEPITRLAGVVDDLLLGGASMEQAGEGVRELINFMENVEGYGR